MNEQQIDRIVERRRNELLARRADAMADACRAARRRNIMSDTPTTTRRQADELGHRRGIASDLSAVVRRLDLIDRQERVRAKDARWIAQSLLDLEAARKSLTTRRVQQHANHDLWKREHEVLGREVDARIRRYLQAVPDKDFLTMPSLKWARKVLASAKAKKATAAKRKTATRKRAVVTSAMKLIRRKGAGGKAVVTATASSTATDLDNEFFSLRALKQMAKGFKGKLAFLNHRYSVPDDVFGTITGTALVKRAAEDALDISIEVDESNPKAAATLEMIRSGTRLGVSVGVMVAEGGSTDEPDGRRSLNDIVPLEASIVGIPANQSAWTSGAKSKGKRAQLTAAHA